MQLYFIDVIDSERRKCSQTYVQRHAGDFYAVRGNLVEHLRREVQAGSGRSYRSSLLGENGLVSLTISVRVIAMNIGRQWHVSDAIEDGEEIVDRGELEQPVAELSALEDFGFERNGAVGSREYEAFADGDFSSGPNEGAPEIVTGGLGEHDFDSAGGLFASRGAGFGGRRGERGSRGCR